MNFYISTSNIDMFNHFRVLFFYFWKFILIFLYFVLLQLFFLQKEHYLTRITKSYLLYYKSTWMNKTHQFWFKHTLYSVRIINLSSYYTLPYFVWIFTCIYSSNVKLEILYSNFFFVLRISYLSKFFNFLPNYFWFIFLCIFYANAKS